MPSIDVSQLKKRPPSDEKVYFLSINFLHFGMVNDVLNCCNLYNLKESIPCIQITWQWLPFTNSARKDNLQLYHWVGFGNFWKCFHELGKRSFLMWGVVYNIFFKIFLVFRMLFRSELWMVSHLRVTTLLPSITRYCNFLSYLLCFFNFISMAESIYLFGMYAVCWCCQIHWWGVWEVFNWSCRYQLNIESCLLSKSMTTSAYKFEEEMSIAFHFLISCQ